MKNIPLTMVRKNLLNIQEYSLPEGFSIHFFKKGDEHDWARIETLVAEFTCEEMALGRFYGEFGQHLKEMSKRCLFIENQHGKKIATTTAWYGDLSGNGRISGRIHWVAVVPDYQGRGLAKSLLSAAMNVLSSVHEDVYLTTQTTSDRAINMYLNAGFEPLLTKASCYKGWRSMEKTLNRKIIKRDK